MKRLEAATMAVGLTAFLGLGAIAAEARAGDEGPRPGARVAGRVRMPDICSPAISPAVVYLERAGTEPIPPAGSDSSPATATAAEVSLINQHGLQFVPRIQAVGMGRTIRFANQDGETHNVHVVTPGFNFNQSMAPGQARDYLPEQPGTFKLTCDVHIHMRGYVIVSPTPWFAVCTPEGKYRLDGVPDGRYTLVAWHEMGDPERREIAIDGGRPVEPPPIDLTASPQRIVGGGPRASQVVRPWADVIDRIGILLASSLGEASKPGGLAAARRLAEDAYWGEFEASDMETAVRKYLGFAHKGELERRFREIRAMAKEVAQRRRPAAELADLNSQLLLALVATAGELNRRGVIDAAHLDLTGGAATGLDPDLTAPGDADVAVLVQSLKRGFRRIQLLADQGESEEAASEVTTIYTTEFEPIERYLLGREPQAVRPFEIRFNVLRGDLGDGLKGDELAGRVSSMQGDVEALVARLEARPAGNFGAAFAASLITIVREGVEIILLLAMLIALVAKTTAVHTRDRRRGMRAIWLGVAGAAVASLITAVALNRLVASAQGRSREVLEGLVMLAAAGILFYVSYWMVSQVESKRWTDFIKRQTRRGIEAGGLGTLALTAFLAVYREGAEIALMYQALIGSQGGSPAGTWGIAAGLGVGLAILAVIALIVRATSVRLPMRPFFAVSGLILFAMSIVFAGNGVFALQTAGIITTTSLHLLGPGLPLLGLHPNVQVATTQGLILGGALLGWLLILVPTRTVHETPPPSARGGGPIEQPELAVGIGSRESRVGNRRG
jgi:high-affinity iron transporter